MKHFIWTIAVAVLLVSCGKRRALDKGDEFEATTLGGGGDSRVQSGQQVTVTQGSGPVKTYATRTIRRPKPRPTYDIVPVTRIVEATSGIPGWVQADLPFTGAPIPIGTVINDRQTPFQFLFDYPTNNYQFNEAHLVIDTQRDSSDTEAIFVDGVFTGRPPLGSVNGTAIQVTDPLYVGSGAPTVNSYFIDFSLAHYKINTRNSFDLLLTNLLTPSATAAVEALSDGELNVITGDDSPVFQAYLVTRGLTTVPTGESLQCATSPTFTFTNVYLHNDGNTVGTGAFTGTLGTPYSSWNAIGTYPAFEYNFDAPLPKVETANITLTNAKLSLTAKKTSGVAAIVVNGIGVSSTGFDRSTATSAVESWEDAATPAFDTFMTAVTAAVGGAAIDLDLVTLFGASRVRDLLAQGKLNVAIAGNLYARGQNPSASRVLGTQVAGPELKLDGTYFTEICEVVNNPDSPLTQAGYVEPPVEYEDVVVIEESETAGTEDSVTVVNDGTGPIIGSLQVLDVKSNAATIVWSTDEGASTQVAYGIGGLGQSTTTDPTMTTFHQVTLTGLLPYKYYSFQVMSVDKYGNPSSSSVGVFTTLR